ncbi:hypothetical protein [Entomomonas asaccharolytica]|uniref:Uncharacterized protein n=1 Tax=Entomomonas asaccharolytica TaxID=2785331 RepID=A0A974NFS2_9GAMM|nr:hypothetical protein [Entomomonas asaccharolytica]QQP85677.1 hypothetical protein JHT90_15135 [Entomomonas asaccharolytica]
MKFLKLLLCCLAVNNFFTFTTMASSDINYCEYSLSLTNKQNNICSNLPLLSPFNDSRTNLILLINNAYIQKATFTSLSSPQNKAPYLANDSRSKIADVPFELTIYDAYLDDLQKTQQTKVKRVKAKLHNNTKKLIEQVMNNTSLLDNDDFLASPALEFIEQIAITHGLNDQERKDLLFARYLLFDNPKADIRSFIPTDPSFTARHFSNYLQGANAFYKNDYASALQFFTTASTAAQPWVKEAATYMIARTLLNQGQAVAYNNWFELDLKKVDQTMIVKSRAAFNNYLKLYPRGRYANSTIALLRRIYWLQGNKVALASSYENLLDNPRRHINLTSSNRYSVADLILEIDNKVYFNSNPASIRSLSNTPKLLFVYDLLKMRSNQIKLEDLQEQQNTFNNNPELYNYLLATYYTYIETNPEQVLTLIPELTIEDNTATITPLQFSGQILRAIALENSYRGYAAEKLWLTLKELATQSYQEPLVELGLALNYEKTARITHVFAKDSPITTPQLRYILLRKNASRNQLQQLLTDNDLETLDKATMIYLLLYKDLLSQNYNDFLADSSLLISKNTLDEIHLGNISKTGQTNLTLFSEAIPSHSEYPCPSPIILANVLQLNPTDPKALNCLGEFSEHYQLPYHRYMLYSSLNNTNNTGSLGTNNPTDFGKFLYSRLKGYQFVMDDETATEEDRAYAVYKAIRCFAGGYNHCDKQDIPLAKRKEWFQLLHSKYAQTLWAKQQNIYW